MTTITQKTISPIALLFLFTTAAMQGMEQLQLSEKKSRPTIKAKIWLKPSALYLTPAAIDLLASKNITTPIVPIGLKIDKVEVVEPNGKTIINWKKDVPLLVRSYEEQQLRKKTLTFTETLAGCFTIENLTFPKLLPAELALHCSNGTNIRWTVHGFPVEATFESNGIFHKEYEESMNDFFANPSAHLSPQEIGRLANKNILEFNGIPNLEELFIGLLNETPPQIWRHGPQGCPDKERFLELIKNNKIQSPRTPHHKNITTLLLNRQTGMVRKELSKPNYENTLMVSLLPFAIKKPHQISKHSSKCEQVDLPNKLIVDQQDKQLPSTSDLILEECLIEMEANKILDECFDEFQANNPRERKLYSHNKDLNRHGGECILL